MGKEGRQASLASDFSITEFKHLKNLFLWHGRLAYQRATTLTLFVIHKGLLIGFIQFIFSSLFYFAPVALVQGWLQVGYSTIYTMLPVFSLILDVDAPRSVAYLFPELYKTQKWEYGLSDRAFVRMVLKTVYQASAIMLGSLALFEKDLLNLTAVTVTALIMSELLNVISEIKTW